MFRQRCVSRFSETYSINISLNLKNITSEESVYIKFRKNSFGLRISDEQTFFQDFHKLVVEKLMLRVISGVFDNF